MRLLQAANLAVPYTFDGPYAHCYDDRAGCMDERHVYLLHELLLAGGFKNALEIGCYHGASTTAFLEAAHKNPDLTVSLCDVCIGEEILPVIQHRYDENRVRVLEMLSLAALKAYPDFDAVLVDGSHDIASVAVELSYLMINKPRVIFAHDTSATDHGYEAAEGAKLLRYALSIHPEYGQFTYEDDYRRDGEETHRGFFMATTDPKFYPRAVELFQKWAAWEPQGALV